MPLKQAAQRTGAGPPRENWPAPQALHLSALSVALLGCSEK